MYGAPMARPDSAWIRRSLDRERPDLGEASAQQRGGNGHCMRPEDSQKQIGRDGSLNMLAIG
jgi:hypothetical protein